MANENQNTGPNTGQPKGSNSTEREGRELLNVTKEIRKEFGDYRDYLKDSVKDLSAALKSYEKIQAKLASINKDSINLKQVQNEIRKASEKDYLTKKKIADFEKTASSQSKSNVDRYLKSVEKQLIAEQKLQKMKMNPNANQGLIKIKENQLKLAERELVKASEKLNVEELSYANALKEKEVNDKILILLKQQEEFEKKAVKNLGLSGGFAKILADKLGVGNTVYSAMVEKSKALNGEEGKNMSLLRKRFEVLKAGAGAGLTSLMDKFKDPVALAAGITGIFTGLIAGLKAAFDFIVGIQDQTVKFARAMNLSTVEARKLKMEFASLSVSSGNLFITSQKMVESQMELTDTLGVTNVLSKEILATNIELKDIAGLDAQTRAAIAQSATITGKTAKETTKSVIAQVIGLKQATGISFQYQKILKEASSFSGVLGLQFAKYPDKLTKALVTTKAMGLELSKLDSIADSFLDFESSISKEFEAQLMTGKDINLMKARELFMNNDLAGAAAEITRQVGTASEFLSLNRFKQDAIASAMGMSRDSMADMLKQQEAFAAFGAKNTKELYAQLELYRKQGREKEAIAKLGSEEAYQSLINASAQERISAFIDKIKQSIADFVESSGIIDKVEGMIEWLSNPENIRTTIIMVRDIFATIVGIVADIASGIITVLDVFDLVSDQKAASAKAFLSGAESNIRSLGGDFGSVSVSDATTRNQSNTGMYQGAAPVNNSMAPKQDLNVNVTAYIKDTKKDAEVRIESSPDQDRNTQSKG